MNPNSEPLNPRDEAAAGTPGSGENVCPVCHSNGRLGEQEHGAPCPNCDGSGKIVEGIGGGGIRFAGAVVLLEQRAVSC